MRQPSPAAPRTTPPPSERGSAYLFALLVLLVLTVIGLSLAIITQSEVQIGASERTAVRAFYGSDAALRVQLSSSFTADTQPRTFQLDDPVTIGVASIADEIHASAFYPLDSGHCALCVINTGNKQYWANDHIVTAVTSRTSTVGGTETLYAERTLTSMFVIQPQEQQINSFRTEDDLNEIRP